MSKKSSRRSKGLFAVSLIAFLCLAFFYVTQRNKIIKEAWQQSADQAQKASKDIDHALNQLVPASIALSEDLTSGKLAKDQIPARLKEAKEKNPTIFGIGVAYIPYAFDPNRRLYAPLYVNRNGQPMLVQIEDDYDYTEPGRDWYHLPLKEGPIWQEPHYGQASRAYLANFTTPFFARTTDQGKTTPQGVVFASMSLTQYQALAESLGLGDQGYAFVLAKSGSFVSHPNSEYVTQNKTLIDLAQELDDGELEQLGRDAQAGVRAFVERKDAINGRTEWVFSEPIISGAWSVGVVFFKDRLVAWERLNLQKMLVIGMGLLTLFSALWMRFDKGSSFMSA